MLFLYHCSVKEFKLMQLNWLVTVGIKAACMLALLVLNYSCENKTSGMQSEKKNDKGDERVRNNNIYRANQYNWMIGSWKFNKATMYAVKHDSGIYGRTIEVNIQLDDTSNRGYSMINFTSGGLGGGLYVYSNDTLNHKGIIRYMEQETPGDEYLELDSVLIFVPENDKSMASITIQKTRAKCLVMLNYGTAKQTYPFEKAN